MEQQTQSRNWPNYNAAQTQEKLLAIRLLSDAIDFIDVPYQYGDNGRPPQDTADMLAWAASTTYPTST